MRATFSKGIAVGVAISALALTAASAVAGNGINDVFNLGVVNGVDAISVLKGTTQDAQLRVNNQSGNNAAVGVHGVHSAGSGTGAGVLGDTSSTSAGASGVYGRATSANAATDSAAVRGVNSGKGAGVIGRNANDLPSSYGVVGQGRYGLVGSSLFGGSGVWASSPNGFAGVEGHSANKDGYGVYGKNTAGGPGVYGTSSGYGVWGQGTFGVVAGGTNSGVWASSSNPSGSGVYGQNTANGNGLFGKSTSGKGVYGQSSGFDGVYGETSSPNFAGVSGHGGKFGVWGLGSTGVYGQSNDGGFAMQANGNAGQSRTGNGWIKAMVQIKTGQPTPSENIGYCFNSQVQAALATIGDCGMGYKTEPGHPGDVLVYFGFDVSDRFVAVTPLNSGGDTGAELIGPPGADGWGWVRVHTFFTSRNSGGYNAEWTWAPFYIVVF